jgi:rhodanese-related sulfurtransferase
VAEFLEQHGIRADALKGGFDAWCEAGYETAPLERHARQAA